MEIVVLGSGSSGNATIVRSGAVSILLEAGLSAKQIAARARASGCDPSRLSAIFISHAHADHVQGAPVFSRRHRVPVYMTDAAHETWSRWSAGSRSGRRTERRWSTGRRSGDPALTWRSEPAALEGGDDYGLFGSRGNDNGPRGNENGSSGNDNGRRGNENGSRGNDNGPRGNENLAPRFVTGKPSLTPADGDDPWPAGAEESGPFHARHTLEEGGLVDLGAIRVRTFSVPHDCAGTVGYVVEAEGMRFGYVTDLGHVTALVIERLRGCDALFIEMNHDPDLLREGPYPWDVKQRIASRHGHLSNEQGATLLERALGADTRCVMLGHISETNNLPGIALAAARQIVDGAGRGSVALFAAEPHCPSHVVRL